MQKRSQFVIATHSPILMAYPDATIYQIDSEGIAVDYQGTEHYQTTWQFLMNPARFLAHLLEE